METSSELIDRKRAPENYMFLGKVAGAMRMLRSVAVISLFAHASDRSNEYAVWYVQRVRSMVNVWSRIISPYVNPSSGDGNPTVSKVGSNASGIV